MVTEKSDKLHETLNFYWDMYDKDVVFTTAWGYSGMVLLDHARSVWPRVPVVSVDTGMLFQETVDFANSVTRQWDLALSWVGPVESFRLPPTEECCEERKALPLQYMLKPYQAWITALRHDQASTRTNAKEVETGRWGMIHLAPMLTWTSEECWKYIRDNDVPVQPLHAQGYRSIGCKPCTRLPVTDDERSGRWAGERIECGIHRVKP